MNLHNIHIYLCNKLILPTITLSTIKLSLSCFSPILSLTFNNMFIIWFLIEINNFIFLCLIRLYLKNKKIIFFYFFTQATASMLIGLLCNSITLFYNSAFFSSPSFIIFLNLILKLGIPSLHFWLPVFSVWDEIQFLFFTI